MRTLIVSFLAVLILAVPVFSESPHLEREIRNVFGGLTRSRSAVIPVAANAAGRFGAHFKTRVVIFNPSSHDYDITTVLFNQNGRVGSAKKFPIKSGQYRIFDNFLEQVFDHTGSGAIYLISSDERNSPYEFVVWADVYTDSASGRFSTTVVNGIGPLTSDEEGTHFNPGISVSSSRRTNIGVFNIKNERSEVEAQVFDGHGTRLQTITFDLKPQSWQQKSISTPVDNGFVQWEANGPAESDYHFFYAVEVDNGSNDGTLTYATRADVGSTSGDDNGGGGDDNGEAAACGVDKVIQPGGECKLVVGGSEIGTFTVDRNSRGCIKVGGINLCSSSSHTFRNTRLNQYTVTFVASKQSNGSWKITEYSVSG